MRSRPIVFVGARVVAVAMFVMGWTSRARAQANEKWFDYRHWVGSEGGPGAVDAQGVAARFNTPSSVVVDGQGILFVADARNYAIRRIALDGQVSTYAGRLGERGFVDGVGAEARFTYPSHLAVAADGTLYVADSLTVRKITPQGAVTTLAGANGERGNTNGEGTVARFGYIEGLAVDADGFVYVSDFMDSTIRRVSPAGIVTTHLGTPKLLLPGAQYSDDDFISPHGLLVASDGTLFVLNNGGMQVRRVSPNGAMSNYAGLYSGPPSPGFDLFLATGPSRDAAGNIFVAELANQVIKKVTTDGQVITVAGTYAQRGDDDGPAATARFNGPNSTAVDAAGNIYVSDSNNHRIRKITSTGDVSTLAGGGAAETGLVDGTGAAARFAYPAYLAMDSEGNVVVSEPENRAIRRITPEGMVSTLVGPDAGHRPEGLGFDAEGNLYFADDAKKQIMKMTPAGTISVHAGRGPLIWEGYADGPASEAVFFSLGGIAVTPSGAIYVVDGVTVRRVAVNGDVTTVAGERDQMGTTDGKGRAARFRGPRHIVALTDADIFVSDGITLRHIDGAGNVVTLAGDPTTTGDLVDGTGRAASFGQIAGMTATPDGGLYVSDSSTIRHVTRGGVVTTIAGRASTTGTQDGVDTDAIFNGSGGLAVDAAGNLYVCDRSNHAIRKGTLLRAQRGSPPRSGTVMPGGTFTSTMSVVGPGTFTYQWEHDGRALTGETSSALSVTDAQPAHAGLYRASGMTGTATLVSDPLILGLAIATKVYGSGEERWPNIQHANGSRYDQILLFGPAATITADATQVTRMSLVDFDGDIVQVEMTGPGALTLTLAGHSGPAEAEKYNQPGVEYMRGHPGIVLVGATKDTHLTIFSVGRLNAGNQTLFKETVSYGGMADVAYVAIMSADGQFGGLRTANVNYYATQGVTGVYAPGVTFTGPVYVGEITAFDEADPMLILGGAAGDTWITGGGLLQANGRAVAVAGLTQLEFRAGSTSHGELLPAQTIKGKLEQDGVDVTAAIAAGP